MSGKTKDIWTDEASEHSVIEMTDEQAEAFLRELVDFEYLNSPV